MYRTRQKIQDHLDYTKLRDGTWQIEFPGFAAVTVRETILDECQAKALAEIDAKLADVVLTPPVTRRPKRAGGPDADRQFQPPRRALNWQGVRTSRSNEADCRGISAGTAPA